MTRGNGRTLWTMELSFQCTCKIPQRDVHPHARLTGGARPWEAAVPAPTRIPVPARTREHTPEERRTRWDTQSHTPPLPPQARPPGLDDLLNSSNYQALTDRQIRPEQGCWGLHGRSRPRKHRHEETNMASPRERRQRKKLTFHLRILPLITLRIFTRSPRQTRLRLFCSFRVTDESASILALFTLAHARARTLKFFCSSVMQSRFSG